MEILNIFNPSANTKKYGQVVGIEGSIDNYRPECDSKTAAWKIARRIHVCVLILQQISSCLYIFNLGIV